MGQPSIEEYNKALELIARPEYDVVISGYLNERFSALTESICESEENAERCRGARSEIKRILSIRDLIIQRRDRLRKEVERKL